MPVSKQPKLVTVPDNREGKRAVKRAAKKAPAPTQAPEGMGAVRGAPQAHESYAPSTWGSDNHFELTTPSGQKCLCKPLSIEDLMAMGLLETINALSGIVESEVLPKAKGQPTVNMTKLMADPSQLMPVLAMVNRIICAAVVAPEVYPIADESGAPAERVQGRVYVDSIPITDRFAIFNEVTGGLDKFASFR